MFGQLVLGRSRLTIEVVAGQDEEGRTPLEGYWLVVNEQDVAGEGLEVRVAVEPHVAEVLVASWGEHLRSCGRTVDSPELEQLVGQDGDGKVRVVVPMDDAARRATRPNRAQRRAAKRTGR